MKKNAIAGSTYNASAFRSFSTVALLSVITLILCANISVADVSPKGSYQTSISVGVPSFHKITPSIALVYDSNADNGPLGIGWGLQGLSEISRSSAATGAPRYDNSDVLWLDGLKLVTCASSPGAASCRAGGTHATEIENDRKIVQDFASNSWTVWAPDGTKFRYTAQLGNVSNPAKSLRWVVSRVEDTHGNAVSYDYDCGLAACYIASISYGGGLSCVAQGDHPAGSALSGVVVHFLWQGRTDVQSIAQGGFMEEIDRRLRAIDVSEGGERVRTYQLNYYQEPEDDQKYRRANSSLISVQEFGKDASLDSQGNVTAGSLLQENRFATPAFASEPAPAVLSSAAGDNQFVPIGATNPMLPAVFGGLRVLQLPPTDVIVPVNSEEGSVSVETSEFNVARADFNGDGIIDFLQWSIDGTCTQLTTRTLLGGSTSPVSKVISGLSGVSCAPATPLPGARQATTALAADLNGDGRSDLYFIQYRKADLNSQTDRRFNAAGFAALSNGDGKFSVAPEQPLWSSPTRAAMFAARCGAGDATGDGRSDIVCLLDQAGAHTVLQAQSYGTGQVHVVRDIGINAIAAPVGTMVVDANGDGLADILVADKSSGSNATSTLTLRSGISLGDGSYRWRALSTAFAAPLADEKTEMLAGDFNGDSRADAVVAIGAADGRSGSFATFVSTAGATPAYIARRQTISNLMPAVSVGDLNGDGRDDLLFAFHHDGHDDKTCKTSINRDHASLAYIFSRPDGRLPIMSSAGECYDERDLFSNEDWTHPQNAVALGVNGDHIADVFAYFATSSNGQEQIVLEDVVRPLTVEDGTRWRPTDVNGDGRTDWVHVAYGNPGAIILTQITKADGTRDRRDATVAAGIAPDADLDIPTSTSQWFMADIGGASSVDPDGRADIVLIDDIGQRIVSLIGLGDGTWRKVHSTYGVPIHAVLNGTSVPGRGDRGNWRLIDVNGDGRADLVHSSLMQPSPLTTARQGAGSILVETLFAQGDGSWESPTGTPWATPIGEVHFVDQFDDADVRSFLPLDVDGDGRTDLAKIEDVQGRTPLPGAAPAAEVVWSLLSRGDGTWAERTHRVAASMPATAQWFPMEVNGDGRTDLATVQLRPGQAPLFLALLSLGDGTWSGVVSTPVSPRPAMTVESRASIRIADIDKDGREDMVYLTNASVDPANPSADVMVVWNRFPEMVQSSTTGLAIDPSDLDAWQVADFHTSGTVDLVHIQPAPMTNLDLITLPRLQWRLSRYTNGHGASEEIAYSAKPDHIERMPLGSSVNTVDRVTVRVSSGGQTPAAQTQYTFDGATYSYKRHRFLGFLRVESDDGTRIAGQGFELTDSCGARRQAEELFDAQRSLIYRNRTVFSPIGSTNTVSCLPEKTVTEEWEGTQTPRVSERHLVFDRWGNLARSEETGDAADPSDDRLIENEFFPNTVAPDFVVDRIASTMISGKDGQGAWQRLGSTYFEYDRSNDYRLPPGALGELTRERRWKSGTQFVDRTYEYESTGNLHIARGPSIPSNVNGVAVTVDYDCELKRFPVSVCQGPLCATLVWDKRMAVPLSRKDANGVANSFAYDVFGRLTTGTNADGSFSRTIWPRLRRNNVSDQTVTIEVSDGSQRDGVLSETRTFDGLDRLTKITYEGGATMEVTDYDGASAQVRKHTLPHYAGVAAETVQTEYDAAGRPTLIINPDNSRRSITRIVGSFITRDERGGSIIYGFDPWGRITQVTENDRDCIAENCPVARSAITSYRYDARNQLLSIRDAQKNVTTFVWTPLGQKRSVCDPDRQCTTYEWNDDDSVASETDGNQSVLQRTYDPLGRLKQRLAIDPAGHVDRTTIWTWDTVNPTLPPPPGNLSGWSLGQVTEIEDHGPNLNSESNYRYDPLGRVDRSRKCVAGACVDLAFKYDFAGRLSAIRYPDASGRQTLRSKTVQYRYGETGRLVAVPGYVTSIRRDAAGNPIETLLQNGVQERRRYDPHRGWLRDIAVNGPRRAGGRPLLFRQQRTHDPAGRVNQESISKNGALLRTDTFDHDDLGRLLAVHSPDAARVRQFLYDPIGNMASMTAAGGTGIPLGMLTYADPRHVHAPTGTGSGVSFNYDAIGQLLRSNNLSLTWTSEHELASVTDSSSGDVTRYDYDWTGNRIRTQASGSLLLKPDELVDIDGTGRLWAWIVADGRRIAREEIAPRRSRTTASFIHTDALGSTRLITDRAGAPSQAFDYSTWGEAIPSANIPARLGFGGGHSDAATGLVYLQSRYYSPAAAHFASPDSIIPDVYAPQSLNRYSYVVNDPVTFSDPTGHFPQGTLGEEDPSEPCSGCDRVFITVSRVGSDISEWELPDHFSSPPLVSANTDGAIPRYQTNHEADVARKLAEHGTPLDQLIKNYTTIDEAQKEYDRRWDETKNRLNDGSFGSPEALSAAVKAELGSRPQGVLRRFLENLLLTGAPIAGSVAMEARAAGQASLEAAALRQAAEVAALRQAAPLKALVWVGPKGNRLVIAYEGRAWYRSLGQGGQTAAGTWVPFYGIGETSSGGTWWLKELGGIKLPDAFVSTSQSLSLRSIVEMGATTESAAVNNFLRARGADVGGPYVQFPGIAIAEGVTNIP